MDVRRGQHIQRTQRPAGILRQRAQSAHQLVRQPPGRGGVDPPGVVPQLQRQHGLEQRQQRDRVVRFLALRDHLGLQPCRQCVQGAIDGIVLEHQQRIEEPGGIRAHPALDVVERRVLVFAHAQALRLQFPQPVAHRRAGARGAGHGQRVDEQAHRALGVRQLRRAAGHGGAEHHRFLPGMALQHQGPGRLHQRVEGDALAPREGLQARGFLLREGGPYLTGFQPRGALPPAQKAPAGAARGRHRARRVGSSTPPSAPVHQARSAPASRCWSQRM